MTTEKMKVKMRKQMWKVTLMETIMNSHTYQRQPLIQYSNSNRSLQPQRMMRNRKRMKIRMRAQ